MLGWGCHGIPLQVRDFFDCRLLLPMTAYLGFIAFLSFILPGARRAPLLEKCS